MTAGPYELERDTWSEPMPRAVKALRDSGRVRSGDAGRLLYGTRLAALLAACEAAGVQLGAYDRGTVEWLAEWGDAPAQVVIGLVTRAYEAGKEGR